jgi:predicted DNA-binding transcriptional regulator AlpA
MRFSMDEITLLMYPKDARKLFNMSDTKFRQLRKAKGFPKPRYPTGKRAMFVRKELEEWVNKLA